VRLATAAVFAAGYLLGTRAGRERYEQIVAVAEGASRRLEDFSVRHPPGDRVGGQGSPDGRA
jgi:hypothetical protein